MTRRHHVTGNGKRIIVHAHSLLSMDVAEAILRLVEATGDARMVDDSKYWRPVQNVRGRYHI